jgi:hypothetical protein
MTTVFVLARLRSDAVGFIRQVNVNSHSAVPGIAYFVAHGLLACGRRLQWWSCLERVSELRSVSSMTHVEIQPSSRKRLSSTGLRASSLAGESSPR